MTPSRSAPPSPSTPLDPSEHFDDFAGRSWLNTAHQGVLPKVAAAAAREAIAWKMQPARLTTERFVGVPRRLRELLGRLVGVPGDEIILANGASYGLHLFANGLPLEAGDEVLLMEGDFPSNLLPWLGLRRRGVELKILTPQRNVLTAAEVDAAIGPRTRLLCTSWVHSFSGFITDLEAVGEVCRERGVWFLVNTTQGLGARPLDVSVLAVDGVTNAGWKWLCGPYATGFCWLRAELLERLEHNQRYWLSRFTADDLGAERLDLEKAPVHPARAYDLFAPANFFNFVPWIAALDLLLEIGASAIERHDQGLVSRLIDGLDPGPFRLLSRQEESERSTLVFIEPCERDRAPEIHRCLEAAGVDIALRRGALRVSAHLHNSPGDIDRLLTGLAAS